MTPPDTPPPLNAAALGELSNKLVAYARRTIRSQFSGVDDPNAWAQDLAQEALEYYLIAMRDQPERTIERPFGYLKRRVFQRLSRLSKRRGGLCIVALHPTDDSEVGSNNTDKFEKEIFDLQARERDEALTGEVKDDPSQRIAAHGERLRAAFDAIEPGVMRGKATVDYFAVILLYAREVGYRALMSGLEALAEDHPELALIDLHHDILRFVPWHLPEHARTLHRDRSGDPLGTLWGAMRDLYDARGEARLHSDEVVQALAPHVRGGLTRDQWQQLCRRARQLAEAAATSPQQLDILTNALRQRAASGAAP